MSESLMKTPLSRQSSFRREKVNFLNWILEWVANSATSKELPFDIPEITALLQIMGFQLAKIEKSLEDSGQPETDEGSTIRISLYCSKSKMCTVLSKSDLICKCQNSEAVIDGKCWAISSTGPPSAEVCINSLNEPSSSLQPVIPRGKCLLIKEIIYKLMSLVTNTDINKNDEKLNTTTKLSRVQSCENLNSVTAAKSRPVLRREQSWEVDPKTSPPVSTSSPLPELCKSGSQTSTSERDQILVDLLTEMEEKLQKAISLLPAKNNTFTVSKIVKRVSNIRKSPALASPTRSTTGSASTSVPKKQTPTKLLTPKKPPQTTPQVGERKLLVPDKLKSLKNSPRPLSITPSRFEKKSNSTASRATTPKTGVSSLVAAGGGSAAKKIKSGIPSFASKLAKATSTSSLKKPK